MPIEISIYNGPDENSKELKNKLKTTLIGGGGAHAGFCKTLPRVSQQFWPELCRLYTPRWTNSNQCDCLAIHAFKTKTKKDNVCTYCPVVWLYDNRTQNNKYRW